MRAGDRISSIQSGCNEAGPGGVDVGEGKHLDIRVAAFVRSVDPVAEIEEGVCVAHWYACDESMFVEVIEWTRTETHPENHVVVTE